MLTASNHTELRQKVYERFPFDVIRMSGKDSVDFLQRITTNDFSTFTPGGIQKTLIITEKGRVLDAVWVIHHVTDLLIVCSYGIADEINSWLNKFIISEDIVLENVTPRFRIDLKITDDSTGLPTDYFGIPARLVVSETSGDNIQFPGDAFEAWRIRQGIPVSKKELVQDYNPLELNLRNWVSFTKGCYIGQEVIARLDTYNKIQRTLCFISFSDNVSEGDLLVNDENLDIGKITSTCGGSGLAVIRLKYAAQFGTFRTKRNNSAVRIEKVFQKEEHGRN